MDCGEIVREREWKVVSGETLFKLFQAGVSGYEYERGGFDYSFLFVVSLVSDRHEVIRDVGGNCGIRRHTAVMCTNPLWSVSTNAIGLVTMGRSVTEMTAGESTGRYDDEVEVGSHTIIPSESSRSTSD